jgi:hypothetical protein
MGDVNALRSKGFNAHHFIELVQRLDRYTGLEKLRFLVLVLQSYVTLAV